MMHLIWADRGRDWIVTRYVFAFNLKNEPRVNELQRRADSSSSQQGNGVQSAEASGAQPDDTMPAM